MHQTVLSAFVVLPACAYSMPHGPSAVDPASVDRGSPQGIQHSRRTVPTDHGLFNLTVGARSLEDSRWAPLDDQLGLGVDFTLKQPDSWIGLNFGLSGAGGREQFGSVDVDAWQAEVSIGPRVYLMLPQLPFYLYGGVSGALVYGELETLTRRTSDTQFAGMASVGLMFELNRDQAIGLEWRTLQGSDFDSGVPGGPNDSSFQQLSLTFSTAF